LKQPLAFWKQGEKPRLERRYRPKKALGVRAFHRFRQEIASKRPAAVALPKAFDKTAAFSQIAHAGD